MYVYGHLFLTLPPSLSLSLSLYIYIHSERERERQGDIVLVGDCITEDAQLRLAFCTSLAGAASQPRRQIR